ncbi:hypothetical protein [Levilactobacillus parabrevis]|uniref:hypothetical protein n=2 Tax=Levilactobacillus parabrevis TaxID=357278 RepID=UPI0021A479E9|nr:hypothetical protein [Levilactobacillus parabrevis]MCT4486967.1 hypothetical protein [Levilactobacillus parabrevis]MCT4490675.1 hypothetical protein [Levilactobacillus parabrevis]
MNNTKGTVILMIDQTLDEILKLAREADLEKLMNRALYEKDPSKQAVFKSLYDYALDERQRKVIQRKHFVR